MRRKKDSQLLLLIILFIYLSCSTSKIRKCDTLMVNNIEDESYWNKVTPVMFIDTLIAHPQEVYIIKTISQEDWYNPNYIVELNKKINDNRICAFVMSSYSNQLYKYQYTTVSQQAKNLINGIKHKRYPTK